MTFHLYTLQYASSKYKDNLLLAIKSILTPKKMNSRALTASSVQTKGSFPSCFPTSFLKPVSVLGLGLV